MIKNGNKDNREIEKKEERKEIQKMDKNEEYFLFATPSIELFQFICYYVFSRVEFIALRSAVQT